MMSYQLQRQRKTLRVKIKIDQTGQVIVIAPQDCPIRFIETFVTEHQEWIETHVAKIEKQRSHLHLSDDDVLIFGKKYTKVIDFTNQKRVGVHISEGKLSINPVTNSETSIKKSLTQFLKTTAEKYIVPRTQQLGLLMSTPYRSVTLREQKTRWGSCSSQGNLNFNWKLLHSPTQVIDYVIIHELAHRTHMNHSQKFWDLVAKFDPEYLKHRGWLKREGMGLS